MTKKFIISAATLCTLLTANAYASNIHTWHKINAANGNWSGRLVITSANENGYFTDAFGNNKGATYDFKVNNPIPFTFGFGFGFPADFNISYTLTLYKTSFINFSAATCQFNISAKSPANPDIRVEKYNGAKCNYTITSKGENFQIG